MDSQELGPGPEVASWERVALPLDPAKALVNLTPGTLSAALEARTLGCSPPSSPPFWLQHSCAGVDGVGQGRDSPSACLVLISMQP